MRTVRICLKEVFPALPADAFLTGFLTENSPEIGQDRQKPAVVVCPGGAYAVCSFREGEPVALNYTARGMQAFVLEYSLHTPYPAQLRELSAAVALLRRRSSDWHIDPDAIAVEGFSAGGHLAACLGTMWQRAEATDGLGLSSGENRPNALVLGYSVLSMEKGCTHEGTAETVTGGNERMRDLLDPGKCVNDNTPPCFLWHTSDDQAAPAEAALRFASALGRQGIPYEMHIFPHGLHGLSNCNHTTAWVNGAEQMLQPRCEQWIALSVHFLESLFLSWLPEEARK